MLRSCLQISGDWSELSCLPAPLPLGSSNPHPGAALIPEGSQLSPQSYGGQTLPFPASTGDASTCLCRKTTPKVLWHECVSPFVLGSGAFSGNLTLSSSMMSPNGGRRLKREAFGTIQSPRN